MSRTSAPDEGGPQSGAPSDPPPDRLRDPGHTRLFGNSLAVAGGQASVALLFLVYILAARMLGAAGFGDFSLGLTIATVFIALPAWGTNRYASILAARDPERTTEILSSSLGLMIPLALAYLPIVWLTSALVTSRPAVVGVALLLGVDLLAREYANLLRLLLRVHSGFWVDMTSVLAERAFMVAAASAVLFLEPSPVLLAGAFAGGRAAGAAVTTVLFGRRVKRGFLPHFEPGALLGLWRGGTPIALRRWIGSLSFRVDTLFLGAMRSASEVGWYGTVYTLMDGVLMLPSVVTGSLGPTLSANFGEGRHDVVNRLYHRGLKYLLTVGIFIAAVFVSLADFVVDFLYGSEYAPAAVALRVLSASVVFIFVRRHATEILDNVDLRSATAWIFVLGLMANVVLNFVLIPRFGYVGAAAATAVTEGYLMAAMVWTLHRADYSADFVRTLRAPAFAIVLPVAIMWRFAGSPIIACVSGGIVYVAGLTLLGAWDEKDMSLLEGVAARLRPRKR